MHILIVEDDPLLGPGLKMGLTQAGYAADWVGDAASAERMLHQETYDLILLDLGLPGRDGLAFLRDLRRAERRLPVLILTARDSIANRVEGLDAGADDYLVKPFDLDELGARVRALARRSHTPPARVLHLADLVLDTASRQAALGDRPLPLSPKEYALLEALACQADQIVPRTRLQSTLYGWGDDVDSNALEVHIHNLRRKLGKHRILTARGVGYRLVSSARP